MTKNFPCSLLSRLDMMSGLLLTLISFVQFEHIAYAKGGHAMKLDVTSPAFRNGQPIPKQYTADGKNLSPPLKWSQPPNGTKSLALICDDPDAPAGTWVHWVVFGIPAVITEIQEGAAGEKSLANGAVQGTNSFHKIGWGGPSPPPGKPHRYFFKLYALDQALVLEPGAAARQVEQAISGHTLAEGQLMGTYQR